MPKKASLMKLAVPTKAVEAFIKGGELPPASSEAVAAPQLVIKPVAAPTPAQPAAELPKPHFDDSADFHPEQIILRARQSMRSGHHPVERKPLESSRPEATGGEKRTSINLDRELHRRLKILAVKKDSPLQDLVCEAIEALLRKEGA